MELKDICQYISEKVATTTLTKENYISTENMLPDKGGIVTASGVPFGNSTAFSVGDVLVSNIRPYFKKIWQANRNGGCSADVLCFRANSNVDNSYFYYLLSQQEFFDYIMSGAKGCKMPRGDKRQIMQWKVELPPLDEQRHIASVLLSLDEKIELNRRINGNLEQQAQALFKAWFVDFEPFDKNTNGIPYNWEKISLSDIMDYSGGSQPPASEFINTYKDGYIRFIQIRDYASNSHITYIPISPRNKLCQKEDIMIARYGASLGRICYGLEGAYNVALAKVIPKRPYYREFLRCYLSCNDFYEGINKKGNRAVQAGFNQSDINSFELWFPQDNNILERFDEICHNLFKARMYNDEENERLSKLRDTLLPRLMSGELYVNTITE